MDYAYKTDLAITNLVKFNISFSTIHNSYLFKNKWVNEYDESIFQDQIDHIKGLLHIHLKNSVNQAEYLQNILDQIWKRIEWLDKNKAFSPKFFELYSHKISKNNNPIDNFKSNDEKYQKFMNNDLEVGSSDFDLFNYIRFHSEEMNHFENIIDFEKGLLINVIDLYRNALINFYNYIYSIHMNVELIDFKNYDFEHLETIPVTRKIEKACNINFDKKSIALFFRILLEERVIVFDESDKYKNEFEMKKFVQDHFTYLNEKNEHVPIKNFNREYSEMKSREDKYVGKQIKIINSLSSIVDKKKSDLIEIQKKNK